MNNRQEYILCAAILRKTPRDIPGCYYNNDIDKCELGYRHHDILRRFGKDNLEGISGQGFYTSRGRFVDRYEAMKIAYEAGQVTEETTKIFKDVVTNRENLIQQKTELTNILFHPLYSEDLY